MSIFIKIFFSISVMTTIFLVMFDSYIIDIETKESITRLNNKITYNKVIYKNTSSQLLFDFNKDILHSNLASLYLDPEIAKIELIDNSNTLNLLLNSKKYTNDSLIKDNIILKEDDQILGEINIFYTKDIINNHINKYQNNIIEFSIFLTIILFIVIFYFIQKFTKSIKKLTHATTQIASGNLSYEIGINSNDEIGILANKFEIMRKSLKNRIDEVHQQLEFQQLLMDTVSVPIYIKDTNLKYIGCNKAFLDFFGFKKEYILGKTISELQKNEFISDYEEYDKKILEKGGDDSLHSKIYNFNGELRDVISYKSIFHNIHNKVDGIVGTIIDITELKKIQKKLNETNITLEEKVKNRTARLKESNEELEDTIINLKDTQKKLVESEKMASLGGLVAGVAHEINTPVGTGITGITHFLQITKDIEKNYLSDNMSKDEFEEYLKISKVLAKLINESLTRTAHLVNSFKKIAIDDSYDEKDKFNVKDLLEEIIFCLKSIITENNLQIIINCKDDITLHSYNQAYSQIITNLIMNSIKHGYMQNKKGVITIDVSVIEKNNLKIIYQDNGKGISKENLPLIFEPFFTTNRIKGDIGLGLNVIYNIVTNTLKGTIECSSGERNGVCFTIVVPLY